MLLPRFGIHEKDVNFIYDQCFETALGFNAKISNEGSLTILEDMSHHKSECGALEYEFNKTLKRSELLDVFKMKVKVSFECNELSESSDLIKIVDWGNYVGYARRVNDNVYGIIGKRKSRLLDMMTAVNDRIMLEDFNKEFIDN